MWEKGFLVEIFKCLTKDFQMTFSFSCFIVKKNSRSFCLEKKKMFKNVFIEELV